VYHDYEIYDYQSNNKDKIFAEKVNLTNIFKIQTIKINYNYFF